MRDHCASGTHAQCDYSGAPSGVNDVPEVLLQEWPVI